jgi:uncharacterized glyoxalase superfamily protein PhnB
MSNPAVKAIPDGMHRVTPHLVCRGGADAIAWYGRAFGAVELSRLPGPDGRLMHAMIRIGDTNLMLCDEFKEHGGLSPLSLNGSPVTLHLYVEDAEAAFAKAVEAGATVRMPLADMFWGDRYGIVTDPFGHNWSIAQHLEDLTHDQINNNMARMCG